MISTMIDSSSQLLPEGVRDRYWTAVKVALSEVFHVPDEFANEVWNRFRSDVENSPIGEQAAIYNSEPINIAMDLAKEIAVRTVEDQDIPYRLSEIEKQYDYHTQRMQEQPLG